MPIHGTIFKTFLISLKYIQKGEHFVDNISIQAAVVESRDLVLSYWKGFYP